MLFFTLEDVGKSSTVAMLLREGSDCLGLPLAERFTRSRQQFNLAIVVFVRKKFIHLTSFGLHSCQRSPSPDGNLPILKARASRALRACVCYHSVRVRFRPRLRKRLTYHHHSICIRYLTTPRSESQSYPRLARVLRNPTKTG